MIIVGAFRAGHGAPPRRAALGTIRPGPSLHRSPEETDGRGEAAQDGRRQEAGGRQEEGDARLPPTITCFNNYRKIARKDQLDEGKK